MYSDSITIIFRYFKQSSQPSLPHMLKPTNLCVCPCQAALTYIRRQASFSSDFFSSMLKRGLPLCNKGQEFYSPHSFRIGAATHWLKKGLSEEHIRFLGHWSSNAFLSYIRSEIWSLRLKTLSSPFAHHFFQAPCFVQTSRLPSFIFPFILIELASFKMSYALYHLTLHKSDYHICMSCIMGPYFVQVGAFHSNPIISIISSDFVQVR